MRCRQTFCLVVILLTMLFGAAGFAVELPSEELPGLDAVSAGCILCHNGSEGAHAGFCLLSQGGRKGDGHAISASYAELAKDNQGLKPMERLPSEIVLHEGKITCATCHGSDPHNSASLVIDNNGSALCRACHLK